MEKERTDLKYFPALTGMRAIAAYAVFIHHFNPLKKENGGDIVCAVLEKASLSWLSAFLFDLLNELHIGVTIFFVLSGFLIALRYIDSFELTGTWLKKYATNRVAKIYPMYFLLTIGTFAYQIHQGIYSTVSTGLLLLIANITFLRGFFDDLKFSGIAQGWTLTVEECFYFSAPFIFYIYRRYATLFLQPILLVSTGLLLAILFQKTMFFGFLRGPQFTMSYTFFGRCVEFFIGIKLALLLKSSKSPTGKSIIYTLTGFAGIILCLIGFVLLKDPAKGYNNGVQHPAGIIINSFILPVFVAILFWGLLNEESWIKRKLGSETFVLLGKSSYTFYLIHMGVISLFISKLTALAGGGFISYALFFIALNVVSIVLFKTVEDKLNLYIRRLARS